MRYNHLLTMCLALILGLSSFTFLKADLHGGHKAFYIIREQEEGLEMEIRMEIEDLKLELENSIDCRYTTMIEVCGKKYVEENLRVSIDGQWIDWVFTQAIIEDHEFTLSYSVEQIPLNAKRMTVINTCFNNHPEFENIVQLNLRQENVSYKLSSRRTSIEHNFNKA